MRTREGKKSAIRGRPVSRAEQEQEERSKPRGAPAERNGGRSLRWEIIAMGVASATTIEETVYPETRVKAP